jgi:hypothetical protein
VERISKPGSISFRQVDLVNEMFTMGHWPVGEDKASICYGLGHSLLEIFLHILDEETLEKIWDSYDITHWYYGTGRGAGFLFGGKLHLKALYLVLAMYVRITGLQNGPNENETNDRPLRNAIIEAHDHFKELTEYGPIPSISTCETLLSRFRIAYTHFELISRRFRSCLKHVGRVIAGDEKLLHFTGDSGFIRLVPSKPDRIGLWFFEACCTLTNGLPYLIHGRLCDANPATNRSIPVHHVVKQWADISIENRPKLETCGPVVVCDSYYMTTESRKYMNDASVPFIAAVNTAWHTNLMDNMQVKGQHVLKPGDSAAIYSEETHELFVHHWDCDMRVGRKYVLSNAFELKMSSRKLSGVVPAYDYYKLMFNSCDIFNRALHDRKFPFRSGGRGVSGENGHCHKFIMACLLQNVINLHRSTLREDEPKRSFKSMCVELSDDLVMYAMSLDN